MRMESRGRARDGAVAAIVLGTRLPFLGPGAGNDNDGWFLVNAAREIAATGRYTTSRFPGYPVQEWLASLVARAGGGPVAMNALSALAATATAFVFARFLRRLHVRGAALAALALVFVPAAYVASVSAMDYLFALAFALAACHARVSGRNLLAALAVGLAIGTRLTTVVLLPAVLLLPPPADRPRERPRAWIGFAMLACAIGALFYVPAWARYGWRFLSFADPLGSGSTPLDFVTGYLHLARLPLPPALLVGQATALLSGVPATILPAAALVSRVIAARPHLPARAFLFAGVLAAELTDRLPQDRRHPWYTDYLLEPDLRAAIARDTIVYLLPGARDRVRRLAGYDPAADGARPLFAGER